MKYEVSVRKWHTMDNLLAKIRSQVMNKMDYSRELSDEEIEELILQEVASATRELSLSLKEKRQLHKLVFHSLRKLDILQELVDDPDITEIMVNGPNHIFYEKKGAICESSLQFSSEEKMQDVIQQIVARHNRVVNQSSPIVDTRLEDGSRVNIVLSPISIDGSAISIRKFPKNPIYMEELIEKGSISREAANVLKILIQSRYSLFISGGTSSGKTTFLNALSQYIPKDERIITIEDSAELQIKGIPNLVRLETRNANQEGQKPIRIRELIHSALRMRPDRIIVGECRGAEAFDMLQAMNTGHDGSLSTGHANSCKDMISRLEMMVLMGMELPIGAIRQQIASGIDIIVHLGRLKDKSRKVLDIVELEGIENGEIKLNPLFHRDSSGGELLSMGKLHHIQKMLAAGFSQEDLDGL